MLLIQPKWISIVDTACLHTDAHRLPCSLLSEASLPAISCPMAPTPRESKTPPARRRGPCCHQSPGHWGLSAVIWSTYKPQWVWTIKSGMKIKAMRDATHHFLPEEGSWQVSGRTGNGISESNYSVSEPRQQRLTGTLLCKIQDTGMSHLLGTTIHRSKGAQKGANVQSWSGVTLPQLTGSPSDQLQTTCSPDTSLEGHSRPWATAGELWEARFILENPSRHLPWTLSWKHCFSVTETSSSQHGPNSGCNGTDTCCQEWDQDMTGNLYQQGLHPKTTLA